jgi:hypothetical protein
LSTLCQLFETEQLFFSFLEHSGEDKYLCPWSFISPTQRLEDGKCRALSKNRLGIKTMSLNWNFKFFWALAKDRLHVFRVSGIFFWKCIKSRDGWIGSGLF